eukprot:GEMP01000995.1.p1 GENE.GEMP01000995.1~~GEMP01000995.1.p1  ORF type:complete len:1579 (+),score=435.24 GEMP01000995.1:95-4831(+)
MTQVQAFNDSTPLLMTHQNASADVSSFAAPGPRDTVPAVDPLFASNITIPRSISSASPAAHADRSAVLASLEATNSPSVAQRVSADSNNVPVSQQNVLLPQVSVPASAAASRPASAPASRPASASGHATPALGTLVPEHQGEWLDVEEVIGVKSWVKRWMKYRLAEPPVAVVRQEDSAVFLMEIKSLKELHIPKEFVTSDAIESVIYRCYVSFLYSTKDAEGSYEKSSFYGRTCVGEKVATSAPSSPVVEINMNQIFFFRSYVNDPKCYIVLEFTIESTAPLTMDAVTTANVTTRAQSPQTICWTLCKISDIVGDITYGRQDLYSGSPRLLLFVGPDVLTAPDSCVPPAKSFLHVTLSRIPRDESTQLSFRFVDTLLPPDFSMQCGPQLVGGLSSEFGTFLSLRADLAVVDVSKLVVSLPNLAWIPAFEHSLMRVFHKVEHGVVDEKTTGRHRVTLRGFKLRLGAHNGSRWIGPAHRWKDYLTEIPLEPDNDSKVWHADSRSLDTILHAECAIILELIAECEMGDSADISNVCVGWSLFLPTECPHSCLPWAQSNSLPGQGVSVSDRPFFEGPGYSPSGYRVWVHEQAQHQEDVSQKIRFSMQMNGTEFIQWLRRIRPVSKKTEKTPPLHSPSPSSASRGEVTVAPKDLGAALSQQKQKPFPTVAPPSVVPTQRQQQARPTTPSSRRREVLDDAKKIADTCAPTPPPLGSTMPAPLPIRICVKDEGTQYEPMSGASIDDNVIQSHKYHRTGATGADAASPSATRWDTQPSATLAGSGVWGDASPTKIDRRDKAQYIVESGLTNLLSAEAAFHGAAQDKAIDWRKERDDPLQADKVLFQFLAYRSVVGAVAERIFCQASFFMFPPARTPASSVRLATSDLCLLKNARTSEPLAIAFHIDATQRGKEGRAASNNDDCDGGGDNSMHRQLVDYMSKRDCEVEVWNADSQMEVGVARVPLRGLIRQGQKMTKVEQQMPVLDPLTGQCRGFLQMLIVCQGEKSVVDTSATIAARQQGDQHRSKKRAQVKSHLCRVDPTSVDDIKKQRVDRLRLLRGDNSMVMSAAQGEGMIGERKANLSRIATMREEQKVQHVLRRMDDHLVTAHSICPPFATATFFQVAFTNPFDVEVMFQIIINDDFAPAAIPAHPAAGTALASQTPIEPTSLGNVIVDTPDAELSVVHNPQEWRTLVRDRDFGAPPDLEYNLFTHGSQFLLKPLEKLSIPFRYLSFRHPPSHPANVVSPNTNVLLDFDTGRNNTRCVEIDISRYRGEICKKVKLTVSPQPCVVDKSLRIYETESTPIEKSIALPSTMPLTMHLNDSGHDCTPYGEHMERYVYCTDRSVHVWWRDDNELLVRLKTPPSPQKRSFFLITYADKSFFHIASVHMVEVHGLRCESVQLCVGQTIDRVIHVPPIALLNSKSIKVFSSDSMAQVPTGNIDVESNVGAMFSVAVSTLRTGPQTCRIHACDALSKELLATWLLVAFSTKPDVKEVHEIFLPLGMMVKKRLQYRNAVTREIKYVIRSSDPALVIVETPEMAMKPLETRYIELRFQAYAATLKYNAEVFLFIWADDRSIQECRMLKLVYT